MIIEGKLENGAIKSFAGMEDENWERLLGITPRQTDIEKLFAVSDWMFRCTALISGALSSIPMTIKLVGAKDSLWDSENDESMPSGLEAFKNVPDLMTLIAAAYPLLGRAYVLRQRATSKKPVGLRWLMASSIEPEIGPAGLMSFRRQMRNGAVAKLPVDDVLYFWYRDPLVEIGEPSAYPGMAAAQAGEIIVNMDKFLSAYFRRGMIRATLFIYKGGGILPEAEKDRLRSWWSRVTSGVKNAFGTEVISGEMAEVQQIGDGISELGNAALTAEKREAISTAFGVPHSLVMSNAANYATAEQDVLSLFQNAVIPLAKQIQSEINRQLFEPLGYWFRFEFKRIEAIQKAEVAKAQMVQQLVGGPVLTVNEGRELLGYDPLEGGDRIPNIKTPEEEAQAQAANAARMEALQAAQGANGQGQQAPPDARKENEVKRLGEHIKSGAYLVKPFKSDILTAAEIEGAINRAEWEAYP